MHDLWCKLKSKISDKDMLVFQNVIAAFAVKGAALLVSLATIPAFMHYFSDDAVLGVWYTVISIIGWILNFDLGIGNGLRNHLVVALTANDKQKCKQLVSSAYFSVGASCVIVSLIMLMLVPLIDWNVVFGVPSSQIDSSVLAAVTRNVLIGMVIQLFLKNITSILYALQKSAINNFLTLCVSVLQLIFILVFPKMGSIDALRVMSLVYPFLMNLPMLIATLIVFTKPLRYAAPSIRCVTRGTIRAVLGLGVAFFAAQVLFMLIANTNEFFISSLFGSSYVVEYQVYYKIFSLVGTLMSLALTPIWSAVTLAFAENNVKWLTSLFRRLERFGAMIAILEFLLVPFNQILFNIWLGEQSISVVPVCSLSFALFGSLFAYQSIVASFANGLGYLRIQINCYFIGFLIKLLTALAASYLGLPWFFVIVGSALALLPFCLIQRKQIVDKLSPTQNAWTTREAS